MKQLVIGCIRVYQRTLSPDHSWLRHIHPGACRFSPTCSEYTIQAIGEYGTTQGLVLGLKRISRCHPWHPGGYDPLPEPKKL